MLTIHFIIFTISGGHRLYAKFGSGYAKFGSGKQCAGIYPARACWWLTAPKPL